MSNLLPNKNTREKKTLKKLCNSNSNLFLIYFLYTKNYHQLETFDDKSEYSKQKKNYRHCRVMDYIISQFPSD